MFPVATALAYFGAGAIVFYLWCALYSLISNFDIQDPEHVSTPMATLPRNNSLSDLSINDLRPSSPDAGSDKDSSSQKSLAATVVSCSPTSIHHVLELGNFPEAVAKLPVEQRYKFVRFVPLPACLTQNRSSTEHCSAQ